MTAPSVYLVHGFLGDCDDWAPVVAALGARAHCIGVELPGHAGSGSSSINRIALDSLSLDGAAGELARLVAATPGAALVGYSMGGRVALRAASLAPESFAQLLLLSAQPGIDDNTARAARANADERLAARLERMDGQEFRRFLHEWYGAPLFGTFTERADFPQTMERRTRQDPPRLAAALRALTVGAQPPLWDALQQIGGRCRYLFGVIDAAYAAVGVGIQRRSPAVAVHGVGGAAHALHREAPAAVAEHLLAMLANAPFA